MKVIERSKGKMVLLNDLSNQKVAERKHTGQKDTF